MYETFLKFINLEFCTPEEYLIAKDYAFRSKRQEIKKEFNETIIKIIIKVIDRMISENTINDNIKASIYENYGLTADEFNDFFNSFINGTHPKALEYKELCVKIDRETKLNLSRRVFLDAKRGLWTKECISNIGQKYSLTIYKVRQFILDYFKTFCNEEDIIRYKVNYKSFINFGKTKLTPKNIKEALVFYKEFANNEEKQYFRDVIRKIAIELNRLLDQNPESALAYLNNFGIDLNILNIIMGMFFKDNRPFRKKVLILYKDYFEFGESVNWDRGMLKKEAAKLGWSLNDFMKIILEYGLVILNRDILNEKNNEKNNENQNKSHNATSKKSLQYWTNIFLAYLEFDGSYKQFCLTNGIKPESFYRAKYYFIGKELYKRINEKLTNETNETLQEIGRLSHYVNNGIEENGVTRTFDYLDLFTHFREIELRPSYNYLSSYLSGRATIKLSKFILPLIENAIRISREDVIALSIEVDSQTDENGLPIPGTGRLLSEEEKLAIFNYLEENNIPTLDMVYDAALRRYLNKTLILPLNTSRN